MHLYIYFQSDLCLLHGLNDLELQDRKEDKNVSIFAAVLLSF